MSHNTNVNNVTEVFYAVRTKEKELASKHSIPNNL